MKPVSFLKLPTRTATREVCGRSRGPTSTGAATLSVFLDNADLPDGEEGEESEPQGDSRPRSDAQLDPAQSVARCTYREGLFVVSRALSTLTGVDDLSGDFENAELPDAAEDEETEPNSESRPHTGPGRSDSSLLGDIGDCDRRSFHLLGKPITNGHFTDGSRQFW